MKVLETENQGRIIYERITREYDCISDNGVEFNIRIEQDWDGMIIWSDLKEDGTIGSFEDVSSDELYEDIVEELLNSF